MSEPSAAHGPQPPATPPPDTFGGRYRLERELARGGMGTVYAARDTLLDRTVALKVLRPEPGRTIQDEFLKEARAAAALKHPGIADVYDAGIEGDLPYIVMEFVPGETLRQHLVRNGPMPPVRAAFLAAEVAAALEYAHRNGVVHCDIKPGNILLTADGRPKLVDFGIARAEREPDDGAIVGTVGYIAPEQIMGEPLDGRADVYGLGAVLYEMLTGDRPHAGSDLTQAAALAQVSPPPAHERNAAVPLALSELVARSLQPDREQRMPSAGALAAALSTFLDSQSAAGSRPVGAAARQPLGFERAQATTGRPRRMPVLALGAVGLLAAVVAVLGAVLAFRLLDGGTAPIAVPQVTGMRIDQAATRIQGMGLTVASPVERVPGGEPLGTVIRQQPAPGNRLARSAPVHLTISAGP